MCFVDQAKDVSPEELQFVSAALFALPAVPYLARPILKEVVSARQLTTVNAVFETTISI
jgi:hypothetical protein